MPIDFPQLKQALTTPAFSPYIQIIVDEGELEADPEGFNWDLKLAHSRPLHTQFIQEMFTFETLSAIEYKHATDKYSHIEKSILRLKSLLSRIKLVRDKEHFKRYSEMVETCDYRNTGLMRFDKNEIRRSELNAYMAKKGYNFSYAADA